MRLVVLLGRILFVAIFLFSAPNHFTKGAVDYAAKQGVPMAHILVPVAGVIALVGALSVLIGYKARLGALLLVIFLVPVTYYMHPFWGHTDPIWAQTQQINFLKNLSLIGASLLIWHFGSGPLSVDHGK